MPNISIDFQVSKLFSSIRSYLSNSPKLECTGLGKHWQRYVPETVTIKLFQCFSCKKHKYGCIWITGEKFIPLLSILQFPIIWFHLEAAYGIMVADQAEQLQ